jgi:hypothetical protein
VSFLPLSAHTVGVSTELPVPFTVVLYGSLALFVAAHLVAGPRIAVPGAAGTQPAAGPRSGTGMAGVPTEVGAGRSSGRTVSSVIVGLLRAVGVLMALVVLAAAVAGPTAPTLNPAPYAVFVVLWTAGITLSALIGDISAPLSPFEAVRRAAGVPDRPEPLPGTGLWPAAGLLLIFVWYMLAHPGADQPRTLSRWIAVYIAVIGVGAAWWGVRWIASAEAFGALFRTLGAAAPLASTDGPGPHLRRPGAGLVTFRAVTGTGALLVVAVAATIFDEVHGLAFYERLIGPRTGWTAAGVDTVGLLVVVAAVGGLGLWAAHEAGRATGLPRHHLVETLTPALVPIAAALAIAHGAGMLIVEGSRFLALLSDPFGRGWDLLGTSGWGIGYASLPSQALAVVQLVLLLVGPVAALLVLHARVRRITDPERAGRALHAPFLVVAGLGVAGLYLVLGGEA